VLSQKLAFAPAERYVHMFVQSLALSKEKQSESANVIKFVVHLWLLKKRHQGGTRRALRIRRKLLKAMVRLQEIRDEQRSQAGACMNFTALMNSQQHQVQRLDQYRHHILDVHQQCSSLMKKLFILETTLNIFRDDSLV
jgi:hypothetical protein